MNDLSFDPTTGADKEFLLSVVKAIVSKPEAVDVARKVDELGTLLTLRVDPVDMPAIIGRGGATVKSLRQLVRVAGAKSNQRVNLKVLEPDGSEYRIRDERSVGSVGIVGGNADRGPASGDAFGNAESAF